MNTHQDEKRKQKINRKHYKNSCGKRNYDKRKRNDQDQSILQNKKKQKARALLSSENFEMVKKEEESYLSL